MKDEDERNEEGGEKRRDKGPRDRGLDRGLFSGRGRKRERDRGGALGRGAGREVLPPQKEHTICVTRELAQKSLRPKGSAPAESFPPNHSGATHGLPYCKVPLPYLRR